MKRFTETSKWSDPWFRSLSPEAKLLWLWLCDSCDYAGVIEPDFALASFQIGQGLDIDLDVLAELGDRVLKLPSGKLILPAFIGFQYGQLSRDCRPHKPVFRDLERHGLDTLLDTLLDRVSREAFADALSNTLCHTLPGSLSKGISIGYLDTLQDKTIQDKSKKEGGCGGKPARAATAEAIVASYPRREDQSQCIAIVLDQLRAGADAETMLTGTRAIAAVIAQLPSGHLNKYVIGAARFFRDRRWSDDPATWLRQGTPAGTTTDGQPLVLGGRAPSSVTKIPYHPAK
jgi:hypothetical protein